MEAEPTIACPHCGAVNRVARARLAAGDKPNCGRRHQPLFDGRPAALAGAVEFDRLVERRFRRRSLDRLGGDRGKQPRRTQVERAAEVDPSQGDARARPLF